MNRNSQVEPKTKHDFALEGIDGVSQELFYVIAGMLYNKSSIKEYYFPKLQKAAISLERLVEILRGSGHVSAKKSAVSR